MKPHAALRRIENIVWAAIFSILDDKPVVPKGKIRLNLSNIHQQTDVWQQMSDIYLSVCDRTAFLVPTADLVLLLLFLFFKKKYI